MSRPGAPRPPWSHKSRRLAVVFTAVLLPAAATLVWLGVRLIEQDRELWAQRDIERHEAAADAVVRAMEMRLADAERALAANQTPDGVLMLRRPSFAASPARVVVSPSGMVAWMPSAPGLRPLDGGNFETAERLEFQGDRRTAGAVYRQMIDSPDPNTRAGALLRLARVQRGAGDLAGALASYRSLTTYADYQLDALPVDLVARRRLVDVLLEQGRHDEGDRETRSIQDDLLAGRWQLDRSSWDLVTQDLARWTGRSFTTDPGRAAMSRAAAWFAQADLDPSASSGARRRQAIVFDGLVLTAIWQHRGSEVAALMVPPGVVERWLREAMDQFDAGRVVAAAGAPSGEAIAAPAFPAEARLARRLSSDTGLPWTITLAQGPAWAPPREVAARQRLLISGLAALGVLLGAGAYLLWRVVQRELAVARLQTEFVSAVSHEFRTPVTSLRHVIELLQEDDEVPRERRRAFYDVLGRSTERLDRLVESLLDFARMEEGRKPYELEPTDLRSFIEHVANEFRVNAAGGRAVRLEIDEDLPSVLADRNALTHALWNLLDNAVKYSPAGADVVAGASRYGDRAAIWVRDSGMGIPRDERKDVFMKFVRGEEALRSGIKGTGVGLAIVSHIVRAHRGSIELDTEVGRGSTFRIVLPAAG